MASRLIAPHGWTALLAAALAITASSACSPRSDSAAEASAPQNQTTAPTTPSTPTSSARSAADDPEGAALAAYRGMWADFVVAGTTADWQDPALGDHATGQALSTLTRGLYADAYNGLVTQGEPILDPAVSSVEPEGDPTTVIVTDCGDGTDWLKYNAEGRLADDEPGGRRRINALVERQPGGEWRVTDFGVHEVGSC